MKKIRVLSGLLVVVLILSMLTTSVFAADSSQIVLSDVPFDYMTNIQTRSFDSYENLSTPNKKLVYSIPNGVAETLTTEALLETILNNEYLTDLFAYDSFVDAVKSREEQFRIVEFLNRSDSSIVLNSFYSKYSKLLKEVENKTGFTIDDVVSNTNISDLSNDFVTNYIKVSFITKLKDNYSNILYNLSNSGISSRTMSTGYVYTKGGNAVYCYFNRGWENSTTSESEMNFYKSLYKVQYSVTEVAGISPAYNCHSYAWHSNNVSTNNVWIETPSSIQLYLNEATSGTQNPQIGITKVVYYKDGAVTHSSKVYGIKSNGAVASVISKWGNNAVFIHAIEECPYYYDTEPIAYRNY